MATPLDHTAEITGQSLTSGDDGTGKLAQGYAIQYKTVKGNDDVVFVPMSKYTLAAVHDAVRNKARITDSVIGSKVTS